MRKRTIKDISVEGFQRSRKPDHRVVYTIKVEWSDRSVNLIYRRYSEVRQLELNLLENFPSDKQRIIASSLQGRRRFTPTSVQNKLERVRAFISNLIALPEHISQSQLAVKFFTSRPEDVQWLKLKEENQPPSKSKSRKNRFKRIPVKQRSKKTANSIGEPVLLEQYVAVKDYKKQYHNDISLTKGYTMGVIEKHESGWWLVECEGDIGWVPASFIRPTGGDYYGDDIITSEIFPPGRGEMYMTTQSYQAKMEGEMSFDIGVHLQVIEKTWDGWWRVLYMDEEAWVPAVYLKSLGFAAGRTPMGLRRWSGMSMRLREETRDFQEVQNNEVPPYGSSFLTPGWSQNRRHSAGEVLSSPSTTESKLSNRRSTVSDIRDGLPNRGLSISEQDIHLAVQREKKSNASTKAKRSNSFSVFPGDIKEFLAKRNRAESIPENVIGLSLPGFSISAIDLHSAQQRSISSKVKRSSSFSVLSDNIKGVLRKRNEEKSVPSLNANGAADVTTDRSLLERPKRKNELSSPSARRRFLGSESEVIKVAYNELHSPPTICITSAASDSELSQALESDAEIQLPSDSTKSIDDARVGNKIAEEVKRKETKDDNQVLRSEENLIEEPSSMMSGINNQHKEGDEQRQQLEKRQDIQGENIGSEDRYRDRENGRREKVEEENLRGQESDTGSQSNSNAGAGVDVKDVEELVVDDSISVNNDKQCVDAKKSFPSAGDIYYALATFEANGPGEITIYKGNKVKVEAKAPNGWWMVQIGDESGWAPSNFLVADDGYDRKDIIERQELEFDQERNGLPSDDVDDVDDDEDDDDDDDDDDRDEDHDDNDNGDYEHDDDGDNESDDDDDDDDYEDGDDEDDNERKPGVWTLPAWRARPPLKAHRGARIVRPYQVPHPSAWAPRNECSFEPIIKGRYATKSSSGTESSSTVKQKNVGSFDSGCPEDEKRKVLKKTKHCVSEPGRMISYKKPTFKKAQRSSYRPRRPSANSEPDGRFSTAWHFSSDDEVFSVERNKDSSSYESEVSSRGLRKRRERQMKRNWPRLPEYSQGYHANHSFVPLNNSPRRSRRNYQAIALYQATPDETIDLYEGDQVQVIRKSRGGWWYVKIDDEEGWVPSNFLQPISYYDE